MCHVSLQLYAQYSALNCRCFSWAHFLVFSKHICSPIKPLKSSQHTNHNWDLKKKTTCNTSDFKNWNKKPFTSDAAAQKNLLGSAKNAVIFMYVCEISTKQPVNMLLGSQHPLSIWFVCILPLYSAWGAGAACDHSQVKDGSLTCSSFEFAFKKIGYFSFRDLKKYMYKMVKYMPQCSFKLVCRTVIQNPF